MVVPRCLCANASEPVPCRSTKSLKTGRWTRACRGPAGRATGIGRSRPDRLAGHDFFRERKGRGVRCRGAVGGILEKHRNNLKDKAHPRPVRDHAFNRRNDRGKSCGVRDCAGRVNPATDPVTGSRGRQWPWMARDRRAWRCRHSHHAARFDGPFFREFNGLGQSDRHHVRNRPAWIAPRAGLRVGPEGLTWTNACGI